jgi:hypothetical protein
MVERANDRLEEHYVVAHACRFSALMSQLGGSLDDKDDNNYGVKDSWYTQPKASLNDPNVGVSVSMNQTRPQWWFVVDDDGKPTMYWNTNRSKLQDRLVSEVIVDWFHSEYEDLRQPIECYTELIISVNSKSNDKNATTLVRSHPDFQSQGPWYEWCLIHYEGEHGSSLPFDPWPGSTDVSLFPGKILAIYKNPHYGNKLLDPDNHGSQFLCLAHLCSASDHSKDSRLTEVWEKEYERKQVRAPKRDEQGNLSNTGYSQFMADVPLLRAVPVGSISRRIYVIEEFPQLRRFINPNDPTIH